MPLLVDSAGDDVTLILSDVGATGPSGTIAVGTTTTLPAGASATVTNSGTSTAAVFNFGIPRGATGATGAAGPNSVTSATSSDGTADLDVASLTASSSIICSGPEASIEVIGVDAILGVGGTGSGITANGIDSYIETSGEYRLIKNGFLATISGTLTADRAINLPDRDGTLAIGTGTNGAILSADITDRTSTPAADGSDEGKVASWDAGGGITPHVVQFPTGGFIAAGSLLFVDPSDPTAESGIAGATESGSFVNSLPAVTGKRLAVTDNVDGTPDKADKLTTSRNIFNQPFDGTADVDGNLLTTGHLASAPSGGEAGHLITLNGTAPTVVTGRSAWWSDGSGNPSFRNGTGTAIVLNAAGTLTGTTLASNVLNSSLTSVGTLTGGATGAGFTVALTASTLTGAVPVANGGTGSTSNTSVGALLYGTGTTTRANLTGSISATMAVLTQTGNGSTSAAPVWTSTTGTGNIVRASSPTITTPVIASISGGTAANDDLTLQGTTNATRTTSYVFIQPSGGLAYIGAGTPIADVALPLQLSTGAAGTETNIGINKNGVYGFLLGFKNGTGTNFANYLGGYMRNVTTDPFSIIVNNTNISTTWTSDGSVGLGGTVTNTTTLAGSHLVIAGTTGRATFNGPVKLKEYTFATLPTGSRGDKAYITDGAAVPIYRANAAGGGSTVTEVFFDGTNWINS